MRTSQSILCTVGILMAGFLDVSRCDAQFTTDFQTNIIDGVSSNWAGDYFVGHFNYADVLIIQNGGTLSNWVGAIGAVYSSSNNLAVITGAGSAWTNSGYLILGSGDYSYAGGHSNRLVITNGGTVYSYHGYIGGSDFPRIGGNSALVADPGSRWISSQQFVVGDGSPNNSLVVSNGALVADFTGYLGYALGAAGVATITGTGSMWTNGGDLQAGAYGGANTLYILDGATVTDATGYVGFHAGGNTVWVSDPGSVWTNRNDLYVGNLGTGNLLVVTNGGAVFAANLFLGNGGPASLVLNGGAVTATSLFATNSTNGIFEFEAGTLTTGGTMISNGPVFVIGDGTQPALFQMSGAGNTFGSNVWIRANAVLEGCATIGGSTLIDGTLRADCGGRTMLTGAVTNNGVIKLQNGSVLDIYGPLVNNGSIDAGNGAIHFYATLQGAGTVTGAVMDMHNAWTNPADGKWEDAANWVIGAPTNNLWCVMTNGGSKAVTLDAATTGAHPETLTITGLTLDATSGATNTLALSDSGTGAPLQILYEATIGSGGRLALSNAALTIGGLGGESFLIDGEVSARAATIYVTNGLTTIGENASGKLTISNTSVITSDTILGNATGGMGTLSMAGSNAIWSGNSIFLGQSGSSNGIVQSGGQISINYVRVGCTAGSSHNTVDVAGAGTLLNTHNDLLVGLWGTSNQLRVSAGAVANCTTGSVGSNATAFGNAVMVTDPGSIWGSLTGIFVGGSGAGNSLVISNGGYVSSGSSKPPLTNYLGFASDGNAALVTGAGSLWRSFGGIDVGYGGSGNRLVISNGGLVFATAGAVGAGSNSVNNTVVLTGTGSMWSNTSAITIGLAGSSNRLEIRDGGVAYSGRDQTGATLGVGSNSVGNSALLTDAGSKWIAGTTLTIGGSGPGNSLVITSNAVVTNSTGTIGNSIGSSNNSVRVSDGGIWNGGTIFVGNLGSSNALTIAGGTVTGRAVIIGVNSAACDNVVELDGGSLILTSLPSAPTLEVRHGKLIINGGLLQTGKLIITNPCAQFIRHGGTIVASQVILDPTLDTDGDGIPNGWEQAHGLDPLDPTDAAVDADGDGMSNLQEYLAGTNPTNSASSLHLNSLVLTGADVQISWTTVGGKTYVVQTNASLGGIFGDLTPPISVAGTGESVTNYVDIGGATNWPARYYRIRLGP